MATLLLVGGLLTACGDHSEDHMPAGKHPVRLVAAVQPTTRSTAVDNAWTGGEQVAVEATSYAEGAQPEVKIYTVAADGALTADDPIWWTSDNEWKRLRAWYCADGSSAVGGAHATAVPGKWAVKPDQRGEGYAQSDLLFATTEAGYAKHVTDPVPMKFYHQIAKVVVNIVKAEYATSADRIRSLRIGGDLLLEAGYVAPDAGGALTGDWGTGGTRGAIEPRLLPAPMDPAQYVATYEALVIPQETAEKSMLTVETALGTTLYYNAPADAQPLAAGKVRTYNITVKADRLEVQIAGGGAWSAGGEENVASKKVRLFNADELKIGDYFYSDGTWSDGGLRKHKDDGSMVIADPKPAPVEGKTVVGIVFQTDKNRIGAAEKSKLGAGNVHGLVMAVKNAAIDQAWSVDSKDEGLTKCATKADNYNDINGYGNCEYIRANRGNFDNNPAFKAAYDYNTTCPISASTTGWYLPSSGQWWDILQNLGGCLDLAKQDEQTSSEPIPTEGYFSWHRWGQGVPVLNSWMEQIATDSKDEFGSGDYFWVSSENLSYKWGAWYWKVYTNAVHCNFNGKSALLNDVRPVLAF